MARQDGEDQSVRLPISRRSKERFKQMSFVAFLLVVSCRRADCMFPVQYRVSTKNKLFMQRRGNANGSECFRVGGRVHETQEVAGVGGRLCVENRGARISPNSLQLKIF